MPSAHYFPRKLHLQLSDGEDRLRTVDEDGLLAIQGAKVILGEPGMGKSQLIEELGRRLDVKVISARRFMGSNNPSRFVTPGKLLMIDGLDEAAAVRDGHAVDLVFGKLDDAGCPDFIICCRSREWQSRSEVALKKIYGAEPSILMLDPFSRWEADQFLRQRYPQLDVDHILEHLADQGLTELYQNPLTLDLMGQVASADAALPSTRAGLFERVCTLLWPEHDTDRADEALGQLSMAQALSAAGAVSAGLILAGADAISLANPGQVLEGDIRLAELTDLPEAGAARAIFSSKLFLTVWPGRAKPVHRVLAEYLGARWLADRARTTRVQKRLLAQFQLGDSVRANLRGLHAWLAFHSAPMAGTIIDADPYGVLRYGETSQFTAEQAHRLLNALDELSARDPFFRSRDGGSHRAAGLMHVDLKTRIEQIIAAENGNAQLRSLLIEGLVDTPLAVELHPVLEQVIFSPRYHYRDRENAATGPLFLDQAGFHLLACLPGTKPLLVRKSVAVLREEKTNATGEVIDLNVMVLAAHADVMLRLHGASPNLTRDSKFFKKVAPPSVTLARLDVPDANRMLEGQHDLNSLNEWLLNHVVPATRVLAQNGAKVMIVETSASAASREAGLDPKHVIRRVLAKHGIATQFIMHVDPDTQVKKRKPKEDDRDFKAINSIIEAIRLSGQHPAPTPRVKSMPANTTVVSVLLDRLQDKGWAKFLPVITRTTLGGHTPEIFWFESGADSAGKWFSYSSGLTAIHATDTLLTPDQSKTLINQAFLDCKISPADSLIVCLDADLRTFYAGLKDSPGEGLPCVPDDAAVVRIRADHQVAQISGSHTLSPQAAHYIGTKVGAFQSCVSSSVFYFVSPSKQFGSVRSQRDKTRYDVQERDLRDPWQQLGVTEIAIIQPGAFDGAAAVAEQVALLCRNPPLWDGHLRLPGPMHLGKQVAADHPIMEARRKTEANRSYG